MIVHIIVYCVVHIIVYCAVRGTLTRIMVHILRINRHNQLLAFSVRNYLLLVLIHQGPCHICVTMALYVGYKHDNYDLV